MRYGAINQESLTKGINVQEEAIAGIYRYPRPIPPILPVSRQYLGVAPNQGKKVCQILREKPSPLFRSQSDGIHLENMRRNLERRLEAAQERGDENLMRLLHQESQSLRPLQLNLS